MRTYLIKSPRATETVMAGQFFEIVRYVNKLPAAVFLLLVFCLEMRAQSSLLNQNMNPNYSLNGFSTSRLKTQLIGQADAIDTSYMPNIPPGINNRVNCIAIQKDDKVILVGSFLEVNGVSRIHAARLNKDGTLDSSFIPELTTNSGVNSVLIAADGKIVVGGGGDRVVTRLNSDGSLDPGFNASFGPNATVTAMAAQNDGRLLICGFGVFAAANGTWVDGITRLNTDGSVDRSYFASSGLYEIRCIAVQPDGMALIAGRFRSIDEVERSGIARLTTEGKVDLSFDPGTGIDTYATSLAIQKDGKVVIGGQFSLFNGVKRKKIARLNTDGSLDESFDPSHGANPGPSGGVLSALYIQNDGCILIAGDSLIANTSASNQVARLTTNGSRDMSFDPVLSVQGTVSNIAMQSDGHVVLGGNFSAVGGVTQQGIARLSESFVNLAPIMNEPSHGENGFGVTIKTIGGKSYVLEYKNTLDDANWTSLPGVIGNDSIQRLNDPKSDATQRLYRVRVE